MVLKSELVQGRYVYLVKEEGLWHPLIISMDKDGLACSKDIGKLQEKFGWYAKVLSLRYPVIIGNLPKNTWKAMKTAWNDFLYQAKNIDTVAASMGNALSEEIGNALNGLVEHAIRKSGKPAHGFALELDVDIPEKNEEDDCDWEDDDDELEY